MKVNFEIGDKVVVFNKGIDGKFFIEGKAKIVEKHMKPNHYYVKFRGFGKPVFRFIDPVGQDNPKGYVEKLNKYGNPLTNTERGW